jgi:glycosyltransferase 2 family protein
VKSWKFWIGLLISVAFLFLVFRGLNFDRTITAIRGANYWLLLPALVAYFAGVWVRSVRWQVLLGPIKKITSWRLFPVVVIGYMANDVLPARIGEIVRAYVLGRREDVSTTATLATIVVERIFDGLVMILFMAAVALMVPLGDQLLVIVRLASVIFFGVLIVFFALAFIPRLADFSVSLVVRVLPGRYGEKAAGLLRSFIDGLGCLKSARQLSAVLGLSVAAWLLEASMYFIIASGFQISLPFYGAILTTAVANLATLVPSSPGYVGPFEAGSMLVLSGVFGFAREAAMSYVIVLHAALYLPVTLLGLFFWWKESLSWREIRQLEQARAKEPSLT